MILIDYISEGKSCCFVLCFAVYGVFWGETRVSHNECYTMYPITAHVTGTKILISHPYIKKLNVPVQARSLKSSSKTLSWKYQVYFEPFIHFKVIGP